MHIQFCKQFFCPVNWIDIGTVAFNVESNLSTGLLFSKTDGLHHPFFIFFGEKRFFSARKE
jgi:hypothetical protein